MQTDPDDRTATRRRRVWTWLRLVVGAAILGLLVWRLGTDAFLDPLQRIDGWSLATQLKAIASVIGIGALGFLLCAAAMRSRLRRGL